MKYYDDFSKICIHCGNNWGAHHAGITPYPYGACPGPEGKMDWENGLGTTFREEKTKYYDEVKVWDMDSQHWLNPNGGGSTLHKSAAGVFTREAAMKMVEDCNNRINGEIIVVET